MRPTFADPGLRLAIAAICAVLLGLAAQLMADSGLHAARLDCQTYADVCPIWLR